MTFLEKYFLTNTAYSLYLLAKWFKSFMLHFPNFNFCSNVVTKKKKKRVDCRGKYRNKRKLFPPLSLVLGITESILRSLRVLVWDLLRFISFPWLQDLRSGK